MYLRRSYPVELEQKTTFIRLVCYVHLDLVSDFKPHILQLFMEQTKFSHL